MRAPWPRRPRTVADGESLAHEYRRRAINWCSRLAAGLACLALGLAALVWSSMGGPATIKGPAYGVMLVVVLILVVDNYRFLGVTLALRDVLKHTDRAALEPSAMVAGERFGGFVALEATPTRLHMADVVPLRVRTAQRCSQFLLAIAGCAAMVTVVIGSGVRTGPMNAFAVLWILVLGITASFVMLRRTPFQWVASGDPRTLTLETTTFILKRSLVVVPAEAITGFSLDGAVLCVETDAHRYRLLKLPAFEGVYTVRRHSPPPRYIAELTERRAARVADEVARVLRLRDAQRGVRVS